MFYFFFRVGEIRPPKAIVALFKAPPNAPHFSFSKLSFMSPEILKEMGVYQLQIVSTGIFKASDHMRTDLLILFFFPLSLLLILHLQSWMMQSQVRTVIWGFKRLLAESSTADTELLCWMGNVLVYACLCVCVFRISSKWSLTFAESYRPLLKWQIVY